MKFILNGLSDVKKCLVPAENIFPELKLISINQYWIIRYLCYIILQFNREILILCSIFVAHLSEHKSNSAEREFW